MNGQDFPGEPLTPVFTGDNQNFLQEYLSLFEVSGKRLKNEDICITRDTYKDGNCLIGFNFRPDLSPDSYMRGPNQIGNFRVELAWRTALPETINLIFYLVYDARILYDRDRNVIPDFNP